MKIPEQQPSSDPLTENGVEEKANEFNNYATRILVQFGVFQGTYMGELWGNYYLDPRESVFFARRFAAHLLRYVVTNHAGRMRDVDPQVLDYLNIIQPPELSGLYRPESREHTLDEAANAVCQALVDEGESKRLILEASDVLVGRKILLDFPYPQLSAIWNVNKAFRDHAVPPQK